MASFVWCRLLSNVQVGSTASPWAALRESLPQDPSLSLTGTSKEHTALSQCGDESQLITTLVPIGNDLMANLGQSFQSGGNFLNYTNVIHCTKTFCPLTPEEWNQSLPPAEAGVRCLYLKSSCFLSNPLRACSLQGDSAKESKTEGFGTLSIFPPPITNDFIGNDKAVPAS